MDFTLSYLAGRCHGFLCLEILGAKEQTDHNNVDAGDTNSLRHMVAGDSGSGLEELQ